MPSPARYVLFDLGEASLALAGDAVAEILPLTNLERPPGAPTILAGFMNLGGAPLPIIAAARLFAPGEGADPAGDLYAHVLRLKPVHGRALGLLVDRVTDVAATADGAAPIAETESLDGLFAENLLFGGRIAPRIDLDRLLLKEEALRIAALAEAAQARLAGWSQEAL
jgi:purine-binding chemotaxis protein CheW